MAFHTPHGSTRFRLPWSWSSFDYRTLCEELWAQCDARFAIGCVTSREAAAEPDASHRSAQRARGDAVAEGESLVRQGDPGTEVYLILDGMFVVEVDDRQIGEIGPGAVVGERAALMNGKRTATLWARTPGRVASVANDVLDAEALGTLAASRERAQ